MTMKGSPNTAAESRTTVGTAGTALSERLRDETADVHDAAERSPFVVALLDGDEPLPVMDYARLLRQHLAVYSSLETAVDELRDDPVAAPFLHRGLDRRPSLVADLDTLVGPGWSDTLATTPATDAYVARLAEIAGWPGGVIAHHYVRYLGDLSGGQILRRILRRRLGQDDDRGLSFYVFDEIDHGVRFKQRYRELLDTAPWTGAEADAIVAEARRAFTHATEVFASLEPNAPVTTH